MRLAIFGATSQIARDLVSAMAAQGQHELLLYARRPEAVWQWLSETGLGDVGEVAGFEAFGVDVSVDAILNFVGVGDPAQAALMGASIFGITLQYDEMALNYLASHPSCRYIFLSSGAAYGSNFSEPAGESTHATIAINQLKSQEWYSVAKLHAECRHRSLPNLPIVDLRVFNYFSRTQDLSARFLITDMLRAIRDGKVLSTSSDFMVRDYLHPSDFFRLVNAVLTASPANAALDCYSRAPVDKLGLLKALQDRFGLHYEVVNAAAGVNATGAKPHYYSVNRSASAFGYEPMYDSLSCVLQEAEAILAAARDPGAAR